MGGVEAGEQVVEGEEGVGSVPMPAAIRSRSSSAFTARKATPPRPAAASQRPAARRFSAARAATARAAKKPLVIRIMVLIAPAGRWRQVFGGGEAGGIGDADREEGGEAGAEDGEFARDQHPHHQVAGELIQHGIRFALGTRRGHSPTMWR